MTFETYRLNKIRLKHRKEREKQEKLNQKRMEREKKIMGKLPENPEETITGV
jgi:hypothetical protein